MRFYKNELPIHMSKTNQFTSVFILFLFFATCLSAQVQYAIKGGLNAARITHDAHLDHGFSFYPAPFSHLGLLANYRLNDRWSVQPEVLFSQSGGIASVDFLETNLKNFEFKQTLSYLKTPILLSYSFDQINLEVGPGIGYLIGTRISKTNMDIPAGLQIFDRKIDINVNAGIKYTIKHFFTQIRWQYSIIPTAKVNFKGLNDVTIERVSFFSSVVQISFGLHL